MFEVAELGQKISKAEYKKAVPQLREGLLDAQFRLRSAKFRVVVVIAGVEAAGKGETLNTLLEWMDARGIRAHALGEPTREEIERPRFFRFWRRMPPIGSMGIFLGSWYTFPIIAHVFGRIDKGAFEKELSRINNFERMLVKEGTVVLKFWLHISRKVQRKRFKELASDPSTAWRVSERDLSFGKRYNSFVDVCSKALRRTNQGHAPWVIVEATDPRYRDVTIARHILGAVQERLDTEPPPPPKKVAKPVPKKLNIINTLDLSHLLLKEEYKAQLELYQGRIGRLARKLRDANRSVVMVFEGSDAAGKGGSIRRSIRSIDARFYKVIPISAPTDEELARPYLWRFWRHLPRHGEITVFDRSWYGRVLVERVEGFARPVDWQRAYAEINDFEEQMVDAGVIVLKFWLSISAEEQLQRFKAREATGYKRYKLTDEDWRNREKSAQYEAATCDMIEKTSTELAPWILVEAEDKRYARVKVVKAVSDALERAIGSDRPPAEESKKPKKKAKKPRKGGAAKGAKAKAGRANVQKVSKVDAIWKKP
jgi:polyphosphate:AMP phosphotransferase